MMFFPLWHRVSQRKKHQKGSEKREKNWEKKRRNGGKKGESLKWGEDFRPIISDKNDVFLASWELETPL